MNSTRHFRPSSITTSEILKLLRRPLRPSPGKRARASAFLLACCLFGAARRAQAQTPATVTDERVWFTLMFQSKADAPGHWRWSFENIVRSRDGFSTVDNAGIRPIVNYVINKHSTVGGGYAVIEYWPAATPAFTEQRSFEQYIFASKVPGGNFTLRERLEQRYIEHNDGTAWRLRQQFRYSHPVKKGSPVSLLGYDELFVHFNDTRLARQGVDQNRIFGGISDTINKTWKFEVGYLNQYIPGPGSPVAPRMNHVLSGNLAISF
jgi:hypothetical protein